MARAAVTITESSNIFPSFKVFLLWILIPFAIAGLLLWLSLKYCMKKYRELAPSELIEEKDISHESQQRIDNGSSKAVDSAK